MVAIEVSSRGSKRSSSTGAKFRKRSATGCCCEAEVEASPIQERQGGVRAFGDVLFGRDRETHDGTVQEASGIGLVIGIVGEEGTPPVIDSFQRMASATGVSMLNVVASESV